MCIGGVHCAWITTTTHNAPPKLPSSLSLLGVPRTQDQHHTQTNETARNRKERDRMLSAAPLAAHHNDDDDGGCWCWLLDADETGDSRTKQTALLLRNSLLMSTNYAPTRHEHRACCSSTTTTSAAKRAQLPNAVATTAATLHTTVSATRPPTHSHTNTGTKWMRAECRVAHLRVLRSQWHKHATFRFGWVGWGYCMIWGGGGSRRCWFSLAWFGSVWLGCLWRWRWKRETCATEHLCASLLPHNCVCVEQAPVRCWCVPNDAECKRLRSRWHTSAAERVECDTRPQYYLRQNARMRLWMLFEQQDRVQRTESAARMSVK